MGMTNDEIVKALNSSTFANGGTLNPEQQNKFNVMVEDNSVLLKNIRWEKVSNPTGEISRLYLGEPITRVAVADGTAPTGFEATPKTNNLTWTTVKLQSYYDIGRSALTNNISKEQFEKDYMNAITKRIANDYERLAIQGDTTAYGSVNTPVGYLLRANNGFHNLSENAHIYDAAGANISQSVFAKLFRRLPAEAQGDTDLRWIMSKSLEADWNDIVAARLTGAGDNALMGGEALKPYGIPILAIPHIPNTLSLTTSVATSGFQLGTLQGPFVITAAANTLEIDIDNIQAGTPAEIVLTVGTHETGEIARQINDAQGSIVASDAGDGSLLIKSTTTGTTSEVDVQAPSALSCLAILGLTAGVNAGTGAGSADTQQDGTFIMLTNPKNLIGIQLDSVRIFSEFNARKDVIEVTVYTETDFLIESSDKIAKANNIRLVSV